METIESVIFPSRVIDHLNRISSTYASFLVERAWLTLHAMMAPIQNSIDMAKIKTLLDIGSDVAIIDALLAGTLQLADLTDIYLIDGDGKAPRIADKYSAEQRAWNNVQLGVELVQANVLPNIQVQGFPPDPHQTLPKPIDLIISLKSWGHHYPVRIYLAMVKRCLSPSGALVLDIRKNTDGRDVLETNGFKFITAIPDRSPKCTRMLFTRG